MWTVAFANLISWTAPTQKLSQNGSSTSDTLLNQVFRLKINVLEATLNFYTMLATEHFIFCLQVCWPHQKCSVNLNALPNRCMSICFKRELSPNTLSGICESILTRSFTFSLFWCWLDRLTADSIQPSRSSSCFFNCNFPVPTSEIERISVISDNKVSLGERL